MATELDSHSHHQPLPTASKLRHILAGRYTLVSLAVLLTCLPMVLSAVYIKLFGVNVAHWDEFLFIRYLARQEASDFQWRELFAQHNEHRLLFPSLLYLALIKLTHWDSRAGMWTSWVLLVLICGLLFYVFRRTEQTTAVAFLKFAPIVWLLHSWRQYENLLWGFQFCFYLLIFFMLLALVMLDTDRKFGARFWLAVSAGVGASFSLANGLLVWPLGLLMLLIQRFIPHEQTQASRSFVWWLRVSLWTASGLATSALYLIGYQKPAYHPGVLYALRHPTSAIRAFLAYLGLPLAAELYPAIVAGLLILTLFGLVSCGWLIKGVTSRTLFPALLVLLSLLSGAMITVGRLSFGIEAMLAPRYTSFALLGLAGTYWLVVLLHSEWLRARLLGAVITLILLSTLGGYLIGWKVGEATFATRQTLAFYLLTAPIQSAENLGKLFPSARAENFEVIRQRGANVYAQAVNPAAMRQATAPDTLYHIDLVDGQRPEAKAGPLIIAADQKKSIEITGWAVDSPAGTMAWGVLVEADGKKEFPTTYGLLRPDVKYTFNKSDYLYAGFSANLPLEQLPPGRHSLRLKIFRLGGQEYYRTPQPLEIEVR
jgi:hypothetical protein